MNKQEIEKQAKEILDKFAKALDEVGDFNGDSSVDREEFERDEGELSGVDDDFNYSKTVDFIPIGKYKVNSKKRADANFQLFYMRKNDLKGYGPIKMIIPYNLK